MALNGLVSNSLLCEILRHFRRDGYRLHGAFGMLYHSVVTSGVSGRLVQESDSLNVALVRCLVDL
jgi:hypothetical protein